LVQRHLSADLGVIALHPNIESFTFGIGVKRLVYTGIEYDVQRNDGGCDETDAEAEMVERCAFDS